MEKAAGIKSGVKLLGALIYSFSSLSIITPASSVSSISPSSLSPFDQTQFLVDGDEACHPQLHECCKWSHRYLHRRH